MNRVFEEYERVKTEWGLGPEYKLEDEEFYAILRIEEFRKQSKELHILNENLKSTSKLLDKILSVNAEHIIKTLLDTLEKVVEEHP